MFPLVKLPTSPESPVAMEEERAAGQVESPYKSEEKSQQRESRVDGSGERQSRGYKREVGKKQRGTGWPSSG